MIETAPSPHLGMTPPEIANFLAAKGVAIAEAFLGERIPRIELGLKADELVREIFMAQACASLTLLDQVSILAIVMMRTSQCAPVREGRWRVVLRAFAKLVREEALGAELGSASPPLDRSEIDRVFGHAPRRTEAGR